MEIKSKKCFAVFTIAYIAIYYLCIYLNFNNDKLKFILSYIFTLFGSVVSTMISYKVYKNSKNTAKNYWRFIAISMFFNIIGNCFYALHIHNFNILKIGNSMYLIQYLMYFIGIVYITNRSRGKIIGIRLIIDILITIIVLVTLVWWFIIKPLMLKNLPFSSMIFTVLYPIIDFTILFSLLFMFSISKNIFSVKITLITVCAIITELIVDCTDVYFLVNKKSDLRIFLDPIWLLVILIIAYSGITYYFDDLKENHTLENKNYIKNNLLKLFIPYISVIILMFIMLKNMQKPHKSLITLVVVTVLLMFRQIFTLMENQKLMNLLQKSNEELELISRMNEKEATTDFLTGLYNRRYIDQQFKIMVQKAKNNNGKISILLIDIDFFKRINDTYGHEAGDMILKQLAIVMQKYIINSSVFGRYGGEEFIGILPGVEINIAKLIGEALRKRVEKYKFSIGGTSINITVSIGVSEMKLNGKNNSFEDMFVRADEALYAAKRTGRNKVEIN